MQISSRASFPEGEIVVTRNPYKANWQACKHGVLALWIFLSIGATGPATGLLQLCKYPVGGLFDSSSRKTLGSFSESPLTRQTCAGTHLVGTSDGGALDWPCE